MTTEPRLIEPAWAKEQLDALQEALDKGSFRQRPPKERAIQRYAQDMKAGKWLLTHEAIAFDINGHLIDGQNRLWAVVRSGVPVWINVTSNVPVGTKLGESPMDVINQGVPRSLGASLSIAHGYENALEAALLARNIIAMTLQVSDFPISRNNKTKSVGVSAAEALYVLEDLNYLASLDRLVAIIETRKKRRAVVMAALAWYHGVRPKNAERLAREYSTLEELPKGSPILALYRHYEDSQGSKKTRYFQYQLPIVANAIEAWDKDEKTQVLTSNRESLRWLVKLNPAHAEKILKRVTA